jgi:hypothetical protein
LFFVGRRAGGEFNGWTAALLLASNALVLMLGRRAISEGALIFTAIWTLFSLMYAQKRPWLTALPAGLAFCAKHSLGALAPVGLLAILWQPHIAWGTRIRQAGMYLALYLAVVLALNPFIWAHPIAALQDAAENRRVLAANQVADRPEQALSTPGRRVITMIGALYLTPLFLAEVGNYQDDTRTQDAAYLANPLHSLLRSLPAGGLLLAVTLFGYMNATRQVLSRDKPSSSPLLPDQRRALSLLLIAAALQAAALLVLVPLPFQRYYLPLVPHACLWAAFGLRQLARPFLKSMMRER